MKLIGIDHIVLCVSDVERTIAFYEDVLGMKAVEERPDKWSLHFGANKISLQDARRAPDIARDTVPGSGNFCVLTEEPVRRVAETLRGLGIDIVAGPDQRQGAMGKLLSVYVRDPDGNLVEISNQINLSTADLQLAPDAAIDLQLHTTFSDGSWTLASLFDYLLSEQFGLVAITDHDCVETAVSIQQLALEKQLPVLVAVEMSTSWQGKIVDLLCFGFDPSYNHLHALIQDLVRRQKENSQEVFENLTEQGCRFPPDALPAILGRPSSQQTFALVSLLKEHGHGDPSVGKLLMGAGYKMVTNDPAAVAEAAHQSGGVCLLAHPGRTDGFMTFDAQRLDQFRQEIPIDGLEVYYPLHTAAQTDLFLAYARRHKLLSSAGSDSHGPDKPPIKYQAELCRALLERVGIQIV